MTLKQKLYDLKNQKQQKIDAAKALALEGKTQEEAYKNLVNEIDGFTAQIQATEALIAEEEKGAAQPSGMRGVAAGGQGEETGYQKAVKAFAAAARAGFPKTEKAAGDMMQEIVDPDGGYTVPQDIVTRVIHLRDAEESLLSEVTVYPVTTASGRRTYKTRQQHTGFQTVAEAGKTPKTATPLYATMEYKIKKRSGYLPVTNELMEDSDENITTEAELWLAGEARATANNEIIAEIKKKAETNLVNLDGIITAWIKLGSAFRSTSKLTTNDDGLAWLGTLTDITGRYLLSPNPADPKQLQLCVGPHVLPVKSYDNSTLASDGTKIPMILGDLKEGIAYWDRRQLTVKVSDVAVVGELNAYEQDLTLWRGSLRDDCTIRDEDAFVNGYIDTAATAEAAASEDGSGDAA